MKPRGEAGGRRSPLRDMRVSRLGAASGLRRRAVFQSPITIGARAPHPAQAPALIPWMCTLYPTRRTRVAPHFGHAVIVSSGPMLPI